MMDLDGLLGVRKGAWSEEEDHLLRKCIETYGEGKWYLVPHRAGLSRCRRSCRLRWLNYLRPNIKRGVFTVDEIDLIIKLHKLLGNRWSLIARRLPGRTANDVKNFWNTNMLKKKLLEDTSPSKNDKFKTQNNFKVIKPQALKLLEGTHHADSINIQPEIISSQTSYFSSPQQQQPSLPVPVPLPSSEEDEENLLWWQNMFVDENGDNKETTYADLLLLSPLREFEQNTTKVVSNITMNSMEEQSCDLNAFSFDDKEIWNFTNSQAVVRRSSF